MAIDWYAYIVNRSLGTDVPTSLAGAVDDSLPTPTRHRAGRSWGWLIGIGFVLAWTIYRAL
jgi:hypothetical protein